MKTTTLIIAGVFGLVALWTTSLMVRAGYQAGVEKARLAADAKKYKAEQGHKIKFGITRER